MGYWNTGVIRFPEDRTKEIEEILKKADIYFDYWLNNLVDGEIEIIDSAGDIEGDLKTLCREAQKRGVNLELEIDWRQTVDESTGMYIFENGELKTLSGEEVIIREVSDEMLMKELQRREEINIKPLSIQKMKEQMEEKGRVSGYVEVDFNFIIGNDIEGFDDEIAEKLTGSVALADISYRVVSVDQKKQTVIIEVSGDATEIIEEVA